MTPLTGSIEIVPWDGSTGPAITVSTSEGIPSSLSFDNTSISVSSPATTVTSSSTASGAVLAILAGLIVTVTDASPDSPSASVTE